MAQRKRTTEGDGLFEFTLTNSLHDVAVYNPGEMIVLKDRGIEPRNARGPRREAQCEAKCPVHLSMAPLHHFHSNLLYRSEGFAPPIAAPGCFLVRHAASVDCRTIKPFCGCCLRGLSEQQTVRTKIFGCPKWLVMAGQLAAVTGHGECRQLQPNRSDSASQCAMSSSLSLSRFSLIMLQLVGSVKEKTPVYSCPELSAENVACVNMGNRAVKTESHHNIALALRPCGPLPMLKSPCLAFFAAVQVRLQHVAFNSSSAHGTNCPMKLLQLPKSSFGCA